MPRQWQLHPVAIPCKPYHGSSLTLSRQGQVVRYGLDHRLVFTGSPGMLLSSENDLLQCKGIGLLKDEGGYSAIISSFEFLFLTSPLSPCLYC